MMYLFIDTSRKQNLIDYQSIIYDFALLHARPASIPTL